ncbi:MAG: SMC family ATPase [Candidatus Methanosuratus sp.]|nr:SMC family ATPase [Candidatus Methanosuratincola sp.]
MHETIIKSIRLKNIRTYEEEEVKLPEGIILFEGGIGAGKSTLLLAMEFALFGLGNEKGTTLLSLGKNSGRVDLTFEVGGKEVRVSRSLERVKKQAADAMHQGLLLPQSVRQYDCWIEYNGARTSYSPKEMKEQVLKILNYNEPTDPKAKSVIFRYAVYTPQEEMKEILSQPPDLRLQTIRKALRIEDYKVAMENARAIAADLRKQAEYTRKTVERLPEIRMEINKIKERRPVLDGKLEEIIREAEAVDIELARLKGRREEIHSELLRYAKDAKDVEQIEDDLEKAKAEIGRLEKEIAQNRKRLDGIRAQIKILESAKEPMMSEEEVEGFLEDAKARLSECDGLLGKLEAELSNIRTLVMNGYCPTCNRPIDGAEYEAHLREAERNYEDAKERREDAKKEIQALEAKKREIIKYGKIREQMNGLRELETEVEDRIFDWEERLGKARQSEAELSERKAKALVAVERYRALEEEYRKCDAEIRKEEKERDGHLKEKARLEKEIAVDDERLGELEGEAERLEAEKKRGEKLGWYSEWLMKYFAVALERIELTVMNTVRMEFEEEFGRWFLYLVEDPSKGVRIDEDFTPLVTQDSYEQDLNNLSGGERTSLALAYRLALNRVVQRNSKTGADLLILDEPTDGFSKDQIGKMGDLLRELGLRQAVIVSHERELEGAVDHIFRIQKDGGKSKVYAASG